MSLDDALLGCLALERQAYLIYDRWGSSVGRESALNDLVSRLADQTDRHRASLWDLALRHDLTPPPRHELDLAPGDDAIEALKFTLRQAIRELSALAVALDAPFCNLVERIRNEDEAQLRQLLILAPEPRQATAVVPERRAALHGLMAREPRWRPGLE